MSRRLLAPPADPGCATASSSVENAQDPAGEDRCGELSHGYTGCGRAHASFHVHCLRPSSERTLQDYIRAGQALHESADTSVLASFGPETCSPRRTRANRLLVLCIPPPIPHCVPRARISLLPLPDVSHELFLRVSGSGWFGMYIGTRLAEISF
ncbi:hypothetical protein BV20DRAFT_655350 [Pilatotrama ljubarskyi]|nr:hypothetical protein BV20DRAFT_655350 [Pilatotrama ljubarskyi]